MSDSNKYTLGESAAIFSLGGIAVFVIVFVVGLPLALLTAWIRSVIWNWFAVPYLHLPHIGVWLMLVIGLFISMFQLPSRNLKEEFYSCESWKHYGFYIAGQFLTLFTAFLIHIWILKG